MATMCLARRRRGIRVRAGLRVLGVLCVWAFSAIAADATILVGLRADDQLVLGTDSKVSGPGADRRPDMCKIHQGRRCFFALTGPIVGPGFDAIAIAQDACSQGQDADAIVDGFMTRAERPYKAMHEWLLRNESDYVLKRAPLSLKIFVIGKRDHQLLMLHAGYLVKTSVFEPLVKAEVKNGDAVYSRARDLPRFVAQNPHWFQAPYARAAERLVEAGMASGWVDVGPPAAVLQVDATGARWFRQGLCPPIDPAMWSAD